jgi:hypothetical protein
MAVLLKIDFEKEYDKVKWSFLHQALRMKSFDPNWRGEKVALALRLTMTLDVFPNSKGAWKG